MYFRKFVKLAPPSSIETTISALNGFDALIPDTSDSLASYDNEPCMIYVPESYSLGLEFIIMLGFKSLIYAYSPTSYCGTTDIYEGNSVERFLRSAQ